MSWTRTPVARRVNSKVTTPPLPCNAHVLNTEAYSNIAMHTHTTLSPPPVTITGRRYRRGRHRAPGRAAQILAVPGAPRAQSGARGVPHPQTRPQDTRLRHRKRAPRRAVMSNRRPRCAARRAARRPPSALRTALTHRGTPVVPLMEGRGEAPLSVAFSGTAGACVYKGVPVPVWVWEML